MKYIFLLVFVPCILLSQTEEEENIKNEFNELTENLLENDYTYIDGIRFKGQVDSSGVPYGHWIIFDDIEMKKKIYEGRFINGFKHGKWIRYDLSSKWDKIQSEEVWYRDTLKSWTFFIDHSTKKYQIESSKGIVNDTLINHIQLLGEIFNNLRFGSANPYPIETSIVDQLGVFIKLSNTEDASLRFWSFREKLEQEIFYKQGIEVEKYTHTYWRDQVSKTQHFTHTILHKTIQYNPQNPKNYQVSIYYPNGQLKTTGFIEGDEELKNGLWENYFENGRKKDTGYYKNNKKIGIWKYWDINQNLLKKERYKNGVIKE